MKGRGRSGEGERKDGSVKHQMCRKFSGGGVRPCSVQCGLRDHTAECLREGRNEYIWGDDEGARR